LQSVATNLQRLQVAAQRTSDNARPTVGGQLVAVNQPPKTALRSLVIDCRSLAPNGCMLVVKQPLRIALKSNSVNFSAGDGSRDNL